MITRRDFLTRGAAALIGTAVLTSASALPALGQDTLQSQDRDRLHDGTCDGTGAAYGGGTCDGTGIRARDGSGDGTCDATGVTSTAGMRKRQKHGKGPGRKWGQQN